MRITLQFSLADSHPDALDSSASAAVATQTFAQTTHESTLFSLGHRIFFSTLFPTHSNRKKQCGIHQTITRSSFDNKRQLGDPDVELTTTKKKKRKKKKE